MIGRSEEGDKCHEEVGPAEQKEDERRRAQVLPEGPPDERGDPAEAEKQGVEELQAEEEREGRGDEAGGARREGRSLS